MKKIKEWYNKLPENEKGNLQIVIVYAGTMMVLLFGALAIGGKI